jgi:hypothetical protein
MLRRLLLSAAGAEEPRRARRAKGGVTGRERAHDVRSERPERQGLAPTGTAHPPPSPTNLIPIKQIKGFHHRLSVEIGIRKPF